MFNSTNSVKKYTFFDIEIFKRSRSDVPKLLEDETIVRIAKKYNKSPAQVCIRWSIQRGCIPVVRSLIPEQLAENVSVFDFKLSEQDVQEIQKLDKGLRIFVNAE